jgi:hypothetical protein
MAIGSRVMRGVAVAALCCATTFVRAAPPTVVPSPGYDRRLQESRSTTDGAAATTVAPANPRTATPSHGKKKHTH